jgi:hypothetical protein
VSMAPYTKKKRLAFQLKNETSNTFG